MAAGQRTFELATPAVRSGDDTGSLEYFEQALRAEPGNLRYASEYRQAVIRAEAYDRCLKFFGKLTSANPESANAYLNYGLACVDKIPVAGSISQVILANTALGYFTQALEREKSWLGLYTRGASYLYWPKVFHRAPLGVADLEQAYKMQKDASKKLSVHARAYVALGDGYWKTDQLDKARDVWREGLREFPGQEGLRQRLTRDGESLDEYINDQLDPNKRVDTDLSPLWAEQAR